MKNISMQRFAARTLTQILSRFPASVRHEILMKMFRHSASDSLDIVASADDSDAFDRYSREFFDGLQTVVQKAAELSPDELKTRGTAAALKALLELDNHLYRCISLKAVEHGEGLHPKHRLIQYHDFFCSNVGPDESVVDIGCGNGFLTSDVANATRGRVVGIDMSEDNIRFARENYQAENIKFVLGDVRTDIEEAGFDVVIMSNVLEHLSERPRFLRSVREKLEPARFLIRVPMYEREWMVPMKQELGVDYMLDAGHEIEYTLEVFFGELREAGLKPVKWDIKWGEIWCVAAPDATDSANARGDS